jgi:hypothetical protein
MAYGNVILQLGPADTLSASLKSIFGTGFKAVLLDSAAAPIATATGVFGSSIQDGYLGLSFNLPGVQIYQAGVPTTVLFYTTSDVLICGGSVGPYGSNFAFQVGKPDGTPWDGTAFQLGDIIVLGQGRLRFESTPVLPNLTLPPEIPIGPLPEAPVFLSEPGTLPEIRNENINVLGFVPATADDGAPLVGPNTATYTLYATQLPANTQVYILNAPVTVPVSGLVVAEGSITSIAIKATGVGSGVVALNLVAINGAGTDSAVCNTSVVIDPVIPAPVWTPPSLSVTVPLTGKLQINATVTNTVTVRVLAVPDKTELVVTVNQTDIILEQDDTFSIVVLPTLNIQAGGDTGTVTGVFVLEAEGPSGLKTNFTLTPTIASGSATITERELDVEQNSTTTLLGSNVSTLKPGTLVTINNNSTLPLFFTEI